MPRPTAGMGDPYHTSVDGMDLHDAGPSGKAQASRNTLPGAAILTWNSHDRLSSLVGREIQSNPKANSNT